MSPERIKSLAREMGPLIGLVLLFIVLAVLNNDFIDPSNLKNLLRQVSINALIAFGMTFVILTGGIDLSVGSILALTSAVMANAIASGMSPEVSMVLAAVLGIGLGLVNGVIIAYGRLVPFIATLATMTIYRGTTLVFTDGNPISGFETDSFFHALGQGYLLGIPVPAIVMLITFAILYLVLGKTPLGRHTYAVGGNEKGSFISGIKINKVKIFAYALSGLLCAVAGAILTSRLNSAQPTAGTGYELDAIAAVALGGTSMSGGKGSVSGTLVGALIIATLNNGLNILNVSSFYQQVVKGIVILLAVLMDRKKS